MRALFTCALRRGGVIVYLFLGHSASRRHGVCIHYQRTLQVHCPFYRPGWYSTPLSFECSFRLPLSISFNVDLLGAHTHLVASHPITKQRGTGIRRRYISFLPSSIAIIACNSLSASGSSGVPPFSCLVRRFGGARRLRCFFVFVIVLDDDALLTRAVVALLDSVRLDTSDGFAHVLAGSSFS